MSDRATQLYLVAVLPPPLTGQTLVTAHMAAALGACGRVRVRAVHRDARQRLWRAAKHLHLLTAWAGAGIRSLGRDRLYIVPDRGAGLLALILAAPLLRVCFREVILHHHVWGYLGLRDRRLALVLRLLGPSARHIALSPGMARALARTYGVPAPRLTTLGNAAHVETATRDSDTDTAETLGFLGNITSEKGIHAFMDTVRQLAAMGRPVTALIAGPVSDPTLAVDLKRFVAEDPGHRRLLGPVNGAAKVAFLSEIDVLLFPTRYRYEAQPLTIYEALSAGCPVLATPRGAIPEQVAEDWLLPEKQFAKAAAARIAHWQDDAATMAAARRRAGQLWQGARARDCAALEALVSELAEGAR